MEQHEARGEAIAAVMSDYGRPAFAFPQFGRPALPRAAGPFAAIARVLRSWRERERERRELAALSPRDLGDVNVAFSAIRDEASRWPWQRVVLGAATTRVPSLEPRVDAMACIVFPFAPQPRRTERNGPSGADETRQQQFSQVA